MRGEAIASKCVLGQNKHPRKIWRHTFFENFSPWSKKFKNYFKNFFFSKTFPNTFLWLLDLTLVIFRHVCTVYLSIYLLFLNFFALFEQCISLFTHFPVLILSSSLFPRFFISLFELFLFPYFLVSLFPRLNFFYFPISLFPYFPVFFSENTWRDDRVKMCFGSKQTSSQNMATHFF